MLESGKKETNIRYILEVSLYWSRIIISDDTCEVSGIKYVSKVNGSSKLIFIISPVLVHWYDLLAF